MAQINEHSKSVNVSGKSRRIDIDRLIGLRIRVRRVFLNMTRTHLANVLGVSHQQLHKYESGRSSLSASKLNTCANALGVPFGYFFEPFEIGATGSAVNEGVERHWISAEGLRICRAYARIGDKGARRELIEIIEDASSGHGDTLPIKTVLRLRKVFGDNQFNALTADQSAATKDQVRSVKAQLGKLISETIKSKAYSQSVAGKLLRTSQARVSALARGKAHEYSLDRLVLHLLLLGWCFEMKLHKPKGKELGVLNVSSAAPPARREG